MLCGLSGDSGTLGFAESGNGMEHHLAIAIDTESYSIVDPATGEEGGSCPGPQQESNAKAKTKGWNEEKCSDTDPEEREQDGGNQRDSNSSRGKAYEEKQRHEGERGLKGNEGLRIAKKEGQPN